MDLTAGSASESEALSFSYDTTTCSASDLDFPDVLSPGSNGRNGHHRPARPATVARNHHRRQQCNKSQAPLISGPLAKDLQTSPEFASVADCTAEDCSPRPAGFSRSVESSPTESGGVSARSYGSIPRFPTLELLMGAHMGDGHTAGGGGGGGGGNVGPMKIPGSGVHPRPSPFEHMQPPKDSIKKSGRGTHGGGGIVPPLILPNGPEGTLRRKRQHSSRRALVHTLRENTLGGGGGELLASSRSVDLCSSRSLEQLMPVKKGARHGGDFHLHLDDVMTHAAMDDGTAPMSQSGPSTQRSSRGPPSSRLVLQHNSNNNDSNHNNPDIAASPPPPPPPGDISSFNGDTLCGAAAAAVHMTNMTLHDNGQLPGVEL